MNDSDPVAAHPTPALLMEAPGALQKALAVNLHPAQYGSIVETRKRRVTSFVPAARPAPWPRPCRPTT